MLTTMQLTYQFGRQVLINSGNNALYCRAGSLLLTCIVTNKFPTVISRKSLPPFTLTIFWFRIIIIVLCLQLDNLFSGQSPDIDWLSAHLLGHQSVQLLLCRGVPGLI